MSGRELFYQEMKEHYNNQFEIKNTLESKANNMVTISGTVATLLFGFGTFLLDKLVALKYPLIAPIRAVLAIGIIANIISIVLSLRSSRTQTWSLTVNYGDFFHDDGKGDFDQSAVDEYAYMTDEEYQTEMTELYFDCIRDNVATNNKKGSYIEYSQALFLGGILTVPLVILIVFLKLP